MLSVRMARVACAALLFLICTSCGETYRPVAFPIIPTPPSPGTTHYVVTISANGMDPTDSSQMPVSGNAARIDTSGDSLAAETETGLGPVHAAVLPNGSAWYVANSLEDTVSSSTTSASSTHTTIALPDVHGDPNANPPVLAVPAMPVFVATTENGNVYVANYNFGTVSVINTTADLVTANIGVDPAASIPNLAAHPVALVELPNGKKVYSVNQGNGSVTSIDTGFNTVGAVLAIGGSPVWASARSDNQRVYVLDKASGNVSVIDSTTTPDSVIGTVPTAAGADFMLYDSKLNRLYVLSSGGNSLWAFDAAPSLPALLAPPVHMVASGQGPCSASVTPIPVSLVALPDGSRIYVASYQKDTAASSVCSQVSVFTSTNFTPGNIISLGSAGIVADTTKYPMGCDEARPNSSGPPLGFRLAIASSADNKPTTRVYVSNCDQGNTAVITTVSINSPGEVFLPDTLLTKLGAPLSAFPAPPPPAPDPVTNICSNTGLEAVNGVCPQSPPPPQNPLLVVAGP